MEIAQAASLGVLQRLAKCCKQSELVRYREPFPSSPFVELLTIDDLVGIQKISSSGNGAPRAHEARRDEQVFTASSAAYDHVKLHRNIKKEQRKVHTTTVLGAEIEGKHGTIA